MARKTHTSTAVKRRYNEKTYTRIEVAVPKDMAVRFTEKCLQFGVSKRAVLMDAIQRFLDEK